MDTAAPSNPAQALPSPGAYAEAPASVASVARSVPITQVVYWLLGALVAIAFAAGGYILQDQNKDIYTAVAASDKTTSQAIKSVSDKIDLALGKIKEVDDRVHEVERWVEGMREYRKSLDEWRAELVTSRKGR